MKRLGSSFCGIVQMGPAPTGSTVAEKIMMVKLYIVHDASKTERRWKALSTCSVSL